VVLLDEVEKAHRRIYDLLLQVMDYGSLSDNTGRKADFRNAILIMTSNVGAKALSEKPIGFNPETIRAGAPRTPSRSTFSRSPQTASTRRCISIHFRKDVIERIVDKFVGLAAAELAPRSVSIELDGAARAWFAKHGFDEKLGARPLARLVRKEIVEGVVDDLLFGKLSKKGGRVKVSAKDDAIKLEIKAKKTGV
jgi:ATP-dependent Clp protease ATP-binding subunit ClpA